MAGCRWIPFSGIRTTVPGMISAGRDHDGAELFVGRANHNGDLLPAKVKPEHGVAYVSYGGYEHEKRDFEVLVPAEFHWVASSNGNVPDGCIQSGRTSKREVLYIGRGYVDGVPAVGKVHRSHGCLYIPYGGKEMALREYEVLVQM